MSIGAGSAFIYTHSIHSIRPLFSKKKIIVYSRNDRPGAFAEYTHPDSRMGPHLAHPGQHVLRRSLDHHSMRHDSRAVPILPPRPPLALLGLQHPRRRRALGHLPPRRVHVPGIVRSPAGPPRRDAGPPARASTRSSSSVLGSPSIVSTSTSVFPCLHVDLVSPSTSDKSAIHAEFAMQLIHSSRMPLRASYNRWP